MPAPRKYPDELRERGPARVRVGPADRACRQRSGHPPRGAAPVGASGRGRRRRPQRSPDQRRARAYEGARARGARTAQGQRDPQGRLGVFREGARPDPTEVSAFIDAHRDRFGVELICRTLDVSASAYYQRASGRRSARAVEDERLLGVIRELHEANYCAYGYRRMWKALRRAGEQVPRCRVQRLMRAHGIAGAKRRGRPWRTTRPDPDAHRRPDLVQRNFAASRPDELWVADLSYLRCWEGVVFFAFVIDAYSRRVVGWQL